MNYKIVSFLAQQKRKLVWFKIISDGIIKDCYKQMLINNKLNN